MLTFAQTAFAGHFIKLARGGRIIANGALEYGYAYYILSFVLNIEEVW